MVSEVGLLKASAGQEAACTQAAAEAVLAFQVNGMGEHIGFDTSAAEAQWLAEALRREGPANEAWAARHQLLLEALDDEVVEADKADTRMSDISWAQ